MSSHTEHTATGGNYQ